MATAVVHVPEVGGFVGPARCFRIDPPRMFDGREHEFVTVMVQPRFGKQAPEVKVYPADETGSPAQQQLMRRVGSFTVDEPVDRDGCHYLALQLLGGYQIASPDLGKGAS